MRPPVIRSLFAAAAALGLLCGPAVPPALGTTPGNTITVNSLADVAANDGQCTLREAITAANSDTASGPAAGECAAGSGSGRDSVEIPVNGTITLTSALPDITSDMLIAGNAASNLTVDGAGLARVFNFASGISTVADMTITGGHSSDGGGIANAGDLTVTLSTVTGNSSTFNGGGISNTGVLHVTYSTISGNTASNSGGGLDNSGTLSVENSTISGNTASAFGGAVVNTGTLTVADSTMSGNSAGIGGGIGDQFGTVALTNSTITSNTATSGGGISANGTETLVNAIVAGNTASVGPDIDFIAETVTTSVIGVPGGKTLADILVPGGLASNGGPTKTIALTLVAGNPAIDSGTASACAAFPVSGFDQRHEPRPAACDIGAYEAQPPTVAAHENVSVAVSPPAPTAVTYTLPTAADEQGGVLGVNCNPPSGSTFAVGTTTVTCTATDAVGHTTARTFNVIVSAIAAPSPPAPTLPNGATASGRTSAPSPQTPLGIVLVLLALLSVIGLVALGRANANARKGSG